MKIDERTYSIDVLTDLAGITRRAVRFYVQSGLLPPPEGTARGAYYTQAHLQRLLNIRSWQDDGLTLEGIRQRLSAKPEVRDVRPKGMVEVWTRLNLTEGVELHINTEAAGLTPEAVRQLAVEIGKLVKTYKMEKAE